MWRAAVCRMMFCNSSQRATAPEEIGFHTMSSEKVSVSVSKCICSISVDVPGRQEVYIASGRELGLGIGYTLSAGRFKDTLSLR